MADDRNNPNPETGGRSGAGDQGGMDRNAPGRNPNEGQSTSQRDKQNEPGQGQGNREGNEPGGSEGTGQRQNT